MFAKHFKIPVQGLEWPEPIPIALGSQQAPAWPEHPPITGDSHAHSHTHTHIHPHTHTQTHTHTHIHTLTLAHTHSTTLAHTYPHSLSPSLTPTHSHPHLPTLIHTHTHPHLPTPTSHSHSHWGHGGSTHRYSFGMWEEPRMYGENPHRRGENTHSTQTGSPMGIHFFLLDFRTQHWMKCYSRTCYI